MSRPPRLTLIAPLLLSSLACGGTAPPSPPVKELRSEMLRISAPAVPAEDAAALAAGNVRFAVDMHARLRAKNPGNFLFSQTSMSIALAMLYGGAATTTAEQMAATLHFTLPGERLHSAFNDLDLRLNAATASDPAAFRLTIANSSWVQVGFDVLPSYLDLLAKHYGAGLFVHDFIGDAEGGRKAVNRWVSDRTEKHIPELFPEGSIDPSTVLVLANAIFFHGDWKKPFVGNSANGTFHAPSGDVSVPMMRGDANGALAAGAGWNAAWLDYVGDAVSMVAIVPDAGSFDAFERGLSADGLQAMLAAQASPGANVILPRFKFETPTDLKPVLTEMGLGELFGNPDLSGIDGRRDLFVQAVVHKATIAVDEKGTTASAATGISVGRTSVPQQLVIDRPFLFFIVHKPTGAILFQGRVVNPAG